LVKTNDRRRKVAKFVPFHNPMAFVVQERKVNSPFPLVKEGERPQVSLETKRIGEQKGNATAGNQVPRGSVCPKKVLSAD